MASSQKTYSLQEFIEQAKKDLDDYGQDWTPTASNPSNEYHASKHTWREWWASFMQYFSWEER